MELLRKSLSRGVNVSAIFVPSLIRGFATERNCRLLVVGGGAGGCSVAAKFTSKLGKNDVIIAEPSSVGTYSNLDSV